MKTTDKESTFEAAESSNQSQLPIQGGPPVRTRPLPLEFPGVHYMDEEEIEAAYA